MDRSRSIVDTIAVPRGLLIRVLPAPLWTVVFLVMTAVEGFLRPDFDGWHQAVSALSLGPRGWLQSINLIVFGTVLFVTALPWRRILRCGGGEKWFPTLVMITGFSFVLVGLIPQDPAPGYDPDNLQLGTPTTTGLLHLGIAGVAALSSVASLIVMARRFSADPMWAAWPAYSIGVALIMVGCIAIYAVWSTRADGFAGAFERAAILLPAIWGTAFVWRLWRGVPFMVNVKNSP